MDKPRVDIIVISYNQESLIKGNFRQYIKPKL